MTEDTFQTIVIGALVAFIILMLARSYERRVKSDCFKETQQIECWK